MNEQTRQGYAFIVADSDDPNVRDSLKLIFALESKSSDSIFENLPPDIIHFSFKEVDVFIDKYFIHHKH